MTKARIAFLGIFATLTFSATATATASGHEFSVEGTAVTALTDGVLTSATSRLRGEILGVKVDIVSDKDSGTFSLEGGAKDKATILFVENALYEVKTNGEEVRLLVCAVQSPITLTAKTELQELSSKLVDRFEGTAPPVLFPSFKITGTDCPLKKADNEVTGYADGLLPLGEDDVKLHVVEFDPTTSGSQVLELDKAPATLESKERLELNDGKPWSALK